MNKLNVLGGSLLLAAISMVPALADRAADEVLIANPYARAVPPVIKNSAMFMTLKNTGDTDHAVVSASSEAAQVVELHTHVNDGGVMRMRKIDQISIKAGNTTVLEPGGLHVMLLGLKWPLSVGGTVQVALGFSDGSTKTVVAPVKSVAGMQLGGGHGKGHGKQHGKHGHGQQARHANPMPNLMKVVKKHGEDLNLSDEQQVELTKWHQQNADNMHANFARVVEMEKELNAAALEGRPKAELMTMTSQIMNLRTGIIATKADCRDNMRRVLSDEQYSKLLEIYQAKIKK